MFVAAFQSPERGGEEGRTARGGGGSRRPRGWSARRDRARALILCNISKSHVRSRCKMQPSSISKQAEKSQSGVQVHIGLCVSRSPPFALVSVPVAPSLQAPPGRPAVPAPAQLATLKRAVDDPHPPQEAPPPLRDRRGLHVPDRQGRNADRASRSFSVDPHQHHEEVRDDDRLRRPSTMRMTAMQTTAAPSKAMRVVSIGRLVAPVVYGGLCLTAACSGLCPAAPAPRPRPHRLGRWSTTALHARGAGISTPGGVAAPTLPSNEYTADFSPTSASKRDWASAYVSNLPEEDYAPEIEGVVPPELKGTLFRNGPGRIERGGEAYSHIFDGDGMVTAYTIDDGKIRVKNRYVRTDEYEKEEAAGAILYRNTFGTQPKGGWTRNLFNVLQKNVANTNIIYWGGRLLTLWEAAQPYRLDPSTLNTMGLDTLDGRLQVSLRLHASTFQPPLQPPLQPPPPSCPRFQPSSPPLPPLPPPNLISHHTASPACPSPRGSRPSTSWQWAWWATLSRRTQRWTNPPVQTSTRSMPSADGALCRSGIGRNQTLAPSSRARACSRQS